MSFDRRGERGLLQSKNSQWLNLVVLAILIVAIGLDFTPVWGWLFLVWALLAVVNGATFVLEPIYRSEHPRLFWFVTLFWFVLSLVVIANDFGAFGSSNY
ncbi:MAG: hypothetical protein F4Z51_09045 [Chloroflexi bacterium]|nr:hypothetical protein [Chloroflexota bacterium]MYD16583.1 hypothetical protein [Chloroflexota bacterium]MYJ02224.1 hypothetical protein [Chloroflexota bacterium]